ncbi:PAF1 complex component [Perkinsela sp. CCAP 1560/4]|nr:PAF1 complex component [Perkinsela sp. CCAP 1560/4]|eukprot:KNH07298.1 PAF1 complex component [Perkinsela sp. CCAP 1560/4]
MNFRSTGESSRDSGETCSLLELRSMTLPANVIEECLKKPTTFRYLKGMFVRVRFPKGYAVMFVTDVFEGDETYTYKNDEYITYIRASNGADETSVLKLGVLSNSEPTQDEYEKAKQAFILPDSGTAMALSIQWETEVVNRRNDYIVMDEMLQLRQRMQSKSTRPVTGGNIVAEKVYLERMLKIDWEPDVTEKFRRRLREISAASTKYVDDRLSTVTELIEKTQANKRANRRCRHSQTSREKSRNPEASFWELCDEDQSQAQETPSQDEPATQVVASTQVSAETARPRTMLERIHATMLPSLADTLRTLLR